jgi:RNA polymerase sigma-70 factor (ECF subfamily)
MRNELAQEKRRQGRSEDPEISLIERAKEGEPRAFDSLIRKHRPEVAHRVRRLCRNDADVDDIVQEVMITLYRNLGGFKGKSSLSTWLYRVATNAFLMHERRKKRDRLSFIDSEPYEEEEKAGSLARHPHEPMDGFSHLYEKELLDALSEAMEALPEAYRQVLLLRRRDGLSLDEVSRAAGLSVASVKSRQYRGKQMLKAKIELDEWMKN